MPVVAGSQYVIFTCSCGNYVAERTVESARAVLAGNIELRGAVYCTAAAHGAEQPEMRRTPVVVA